MFEGLTLMRFIAGFTVLGAVSHFVTAFAESCESLCSGLDDCRNDPHAHGSYCKEDHNPKTCFGLYFTDDSLSTMCFGPNSSVPCSTARPVTCPVPKDICQASCDSLESCANDKHGSYCKSYQTVPVCFGLYFTDSTRTQMCFEPTDANCPEDIPVGCSDGIEARSVITPSLRSAITTTAPITTAPATTISAKSLTSVTTNSPTTSGATTTPVPVTTSATTSEPPRSTVSVRRPRMLDLPRPPSPQASTTPLVQKPTGSYSGKVVFSRLEISLDAEFKDSTVDLNFKSAIVNASGSGIGYTASTDPKTGTIKISLVDNAALQVFLSKFPMKLTPASIEITYDARTDQITGQFMGITIVGTKTV